jgi:hypothetical protein
MRPREARIFGRVLENDRYLSLFECSCGRRDWITESVETTKVFTCKICGERYVLVKTSNLHYRVKQEIK